MLEGIDEEKGGVEVFDRSIEEMNIKDWKPVEGEALRN